MADLRLTDSEGARLFQHVTSREQAGLPPIYSTTEDPISAPGLHGRELSEFWDRIWDRANNTLANTLPDRSLAAWRLLRYLAVERGVIQPDQPVSNVLSVQVESTKFTSFREIDNPWMRHLLEQGVSLVPPLVPEPQRLTNGGVTEDYEPEDDEALERWCELVRYVGQGILSLDMSGRARRGFAWFVNPAMVRAGWPPLPVLFRFEAQLVSDAIELLIENSERMARAEIAATWDLGPDEVEQVLALCKQGMALRARFDDRDGFKALVLARMEEALEQAKDALDHRGRALILKEMFKVFSYRGEQDVDDEFSEMSNAIGAAALERRTNRKTLP